MKVREGGRVINAVVLLATGVNGDGHREVLGIRVATSETGAAWNEFFADLVARGLTGVRLVTSDAHAALVEAVAAKIRAGSLRRHGLGSLDRLFCDPGGHHPPFQDVTVLPSLDGTRSASTSITNEVSLDFDAPSHCYVDAWKDFGLRTLCGLGGVRPPLTCTNTLAHTLKRNSTTSPSAMT